MTATRVLSKFLKVHVLILAFLHVSFFISMHANSCFGHFTPYILVHKTFQEKKSLLHNLSKIQLYLILFTHIYLLNSFTCLP